MTLEWARFETVLAQKVPALHASLRPPASGDDLAAAESRVGLRFPEEVRRAYLRHNGSAPSTTSQANQGLLFFPFNWWASLDQLVAEWETRRSVAEQLRAEDPELFPEPRDSWRGLKVKPLWWNERWLPIGLSGTATCVCVDLDPGPAGDVGQIIVDQGTQEAQVIASSLDEYLGKICRCLEDNSLEYRGGWIPVGPLGAAGVGGYFWSDLP